MSMRGRPVVILVLGLLMALPVAEAPSAERVPRVGVFGTVSPESPVAHLFVEFQKGLHDLGYAEGKNIAIEWRDSKGDAKRIQELAAELVGLDVDVIVAPASTLAIATKRATSTIPIVTLSGDPIADGLVRNLARPGGNVTGLSTQSSDVIGKQLELLKRAVPRSSRVAILSNPDNAFHAAQITEAKTAAGVLGAQLDVFKAADSRQLDNAFAEIAKARSDALLVLVDGTVFLRHRARIADLAGKIHLPAMYPRREHVEAGGLIAYGADRRDLFRRLALYVDKILKGAAPAGLPVEQPTKFELVINLKTAKALGLTIPPLLLQRADHVIQ